MTTSVASPGSGAIGTDAEVRRIRVLYQLLARLSQAVALEEIYETALASLLDGTGADRAAILLFDDDGVIRFKASRGLSEEYKQAITGHSPSTYGRRDARPIVVPDALRDEEWPGYRELLRREGVGALTFIPLVLDSGVFGKFILYYPAPHECREDELEIAQAIASHVALATERKRAELARIRAEQQMHAILDNSPAVIFLKDVEGRYLFVNRRHEELFKVTRAEIVGKTDSEIFAPEWAEQFRANDLAILAADKPVSLEECAPHDDGVHTYVSVKFPLHGSDGAVAVCGIATDITERKALETTSLRLAAIVESSTDAIVGKDLDGIVTSWNLGAEHVFGYASAEMIGKPVSILAPPDRIDEMPGIMARAREGKTIEHFETRRRRKDGVIIDVALTVSPVRDAARRVIGASGIARDITDRKRAEREHEILLEREREARRTAELLNQVGPRLAAQLMDSQKLVQEITDAATTLVGAEFGAFFHNAINEKGESYMLYTLSGVPREAFASFPMPRNTAVFAPTFRGEGIVRCDDVKKDPRYGGNAPHHGMPEGHLPVCSYLAAPVIARSGEVLGGLFFGHGMPGRFTDRHEAIIAGIAANAAIALDNARLFEQTQWGRAELTRSNEELRRANRDLEIFAYSASHDLQEPLRNITITAQLLERSWAADVHTHDAVMLRTILTASRRMTDLTRDLLAYTDAARCEEGPPPTVDPGPVLAEVIESLRIPIEEARVRVSTGPLPRAAIHASRLAQLFQNLVSNAVKYRNQEDPFVHVAGTERDGWCVFSVVDNGIGIEPQYAEQIFGLFKRLHARDQYPGSGIGLGICQRLVEQYGGRIWLEHSEPGSGSTFCFSIPARS